MYRVLLVALLLLAIPAVARADAAVGAGAKPGDTSAKPKATGKEETSTSEPTRPQAVIVVDAVPGMFQAVTTVLAVVMLAIIIAQLVFLRSTIEKMSSERPGGSPLR
jgi:hypothetical protein